MGDFSEFNQLASWQNGSMGQGFPDPWMDQASRAIPESTNRILRYAEYIFGVTGIYSQAMQRVLSYFITDIDVSGDFGDDERTKRKKFVNETMGLRDTIRMLGMDYCCFHGDTKTITRDGVFKLRDLAGQTVDVLSQGGVYRSAKFKSFGRQELLEVEFNDGRTVLATPEHQWIVRSGGKTHILPTTRLKPCHEIERTVAPRPSQNEDFYEGVRHGFTFGDGCRYASNKRKPHNYSQAYFYGDKDLELVKYFEGCGSAPVKYGNKTVVRNLPLHYKSLPANNASASYWYGFTCGFLAADGSCDTYGCAVLTQVARAPIDAIVEQLPRIGMVAGPVRSQQRTTDLSRYSGKKAIYDSTIHFVTLLKRFMLPQDFLLSKHRKNFEDNFHGEPPGKYIGIRGVKHTGIIDEVFCCVEPETHTLVLENGVITRNCYGQVIFAVILPILRYLRCPGKRENGQPCGSEHPLRRVMEVSDFKFKWVNFAFHAKCPKCGYEGDWGKPIDRRGRPEDVIVKRFNPHQIELKFDDWTEKCEYIWKIPADYRKVIREGKNTLALEQVNWDVVQAIKHDQYFKLADDFVFHLKEPPLAGYITRGWSIPPAIKNFRQLWYLQVLHRFNEALALDYIIPFRVITPGTKNSTDGAATEPLLNFSMASFNSRVQAMLRRHRRDPAQWNVLPWPIQYQALGGDARQLAPKDLLDQGYEMLLTSIGIPVQMFKGDMTLQAAPAALRMFESYWSHIPTILNKALDFIGKRLEHMFSWQPATLKLGRVTHIDNLMRQQVLLQLMMGGNISQTTGLASVNLDLREEIRRKLDEQAYQAEEEREQQEAESKNMSMKQIMQGQQQPQGQPGQDPNAQGGQQGGAQGGQAAVPGNGGAGLQSPTANMPTNPNAPIRPQDILGEAQNIAGQLMTMPESQRVSELGTIRKSNPMLHMLVRSSLDNMRSQMRSQGGAQMQQQMQQGGQQGGQ